MLGADALPGSGTLLATQVQCCQACCPVWGIPVSTQQERHLVCPPWGQESTQPLAEEAWGRRQLARVQVGTPEMGPA